jgi:uncharacterized lipoprotein YajG
VRRLDIGRQLGAPQINSASTPIARKVRATPKEAKMKLVSIVALTAVALALAGCATANTTGIRTTASVATPAPATVKTPIMQPYTLDPNSSNYWIKQ